MAKETYYVFADGGVKDEYGMPKLHFRTRQINLNADWAALNSFLKTCPNFHEMQPEYKLPDELKGKDGLRELTAVEIEKWEASIKEETGLVKKLKWKQ
ncbi:MAG: hypothetical protein ABIH63_03105 [archaeon]